MLNTLEFGKLLRAYDYDFYSGVPCSFLKYLINHAINHQTYIKATNEGEAVAVSTGAFMAGRKAVVLLQNSGLTNALSPLTSLNNINNLPILAFVGYRGAKNLNDEPQHELMGKASGSILKSVGIKYEVLSSNPLEVRNQIKSADLHVTKNKKSYFFLVPKNTFAEEKLVDKIRHISFDESSLISKCKKDSLPSRESALKTILRNTHNNVAIMATTGKTGRELYQMENRLSNFYMVGSMGCVSSIALGFSLSKPNTKVIAIDGDGALLMRLGNLATNGHYKPRNLLHILLDNEVHDSTGGQETVSKYISFTSIAHATNYPQSIYCHDLQDLGASIQNWFKNPKLTFIHLKISRNKSQILGRPKESPAERCTLFCQNFNK